LHVLAGRRLGCVLTLTAAVVVLAVGATAFLPRPPRQAVSPGYAALDAAKEDRPGPPPLKGKAAPAPLKGFIDATILRPEGGTTRALGLGEPGALPLQLGKDYVRVEAELNRP